MRKPLSNHVLDPVTFGFGTVWHRPVGGKQGTGGLRRTVETSRFDEAFAGQAGLCRGNYASMFSNYPENVDDAHLRQRAGARVLAANAG
jgi:hypothetical protein